MPVSTCCGAAGDLIQKSSSRAATIARRLRPVISSATAHSRRSVHRLLHSLPPACASSAFHPLTQQRSLQLTPACFAVVVHAGLICFCTGAALLRARPLTLICVQGRCKSDWDEGDAMETETGVRRKQRRASRRAE